MALQCEHCQKTFPTNTSLYKHKHREHNNSTLLLVNHDHRKMSGNRAPKRSRSSQPDGSLGLPKQIIKKPRVSNNADPQNDDGLIVIDEYNDPGKNPLDTDPKPLPPKYDPQDELQIIDEYKPDEDNDDQLTVIDSYEDDGQSDDNLSVIDRFDDGQRKITNDYKKKYLDCLKAHKSQRAKFLKKIAQMSNNYKINIDRIKKQLYDQCQEKIDKLKKFHERQMSDLEDLLKAKQDDAIQDLTKVHDKVINDLKIIHKRELDDNEKECQRKLKLLNDQIKAMQEDNEDLSSLSKAIFNCTTMEEIFEIQKLVNNYELDKVIQNHLPTLQNMFLSLSYGILPICQPQRDQVSDNQREVVERIQTASPQTAKRILQQNRSDIVNLFTIIKKSIKLARDSYNRYGIA